MRIVRLCIAMLFALLAASACTDGPTAPNTIGADGSGPTRYLLDPITVIGTPKCDPWLDLNWCQGSGTGDRGSCMTSTGTIDPEHVYVSSCPGTEPGGGGPGGSGDTDGGGATTCDPRTDPDCEQPLTPDDLTTIANVIATYVRAASEIADETARQRCEAMLQQFNTSNAAGSVFRGGTDTNHYGAMYQNRIHFDPKYLDAAAAGDAVAQREIANTALHEAAHVLGFTHPAGPTWQDGQDYYSDQPFNLLSPGPNSCIRY